MDIGFEASRVLDKNPTGVNRYANQLISAVKNADSGAKISLYYKISRINKRKYWIKQGSLSSRIHFGDMWQPFRKPEIIHGLEGYVPNWKSVGKLVTFHDIFPLINQEDYVCPQSFREKILGYYSRAAAIADRVIADSENTKRDLINRFEIDEAKVVTVYPGIDATFESDAQSAAPSADRTDNKDFFLFVGAISGRKNTTRIVEAFSRSKASREFDLVMVGPVAYYGEYTLKAIKKHRMEGRVLLPGYVSEEELHNFYKNASGFVFPTLYEGFGFPVLDAMRMELPVLTSNIGSSPEVAGGFAKTVDPYDVDAIANGIDALTDPDQFDLAAAKKHALGFTWEKSARQLLTIYKQLL